MRGLSLAVMLVLCGCAELPPTEDLAGLVEEARKTGTNGIYPSGQPAAVPVVRDVEMVPCPGIVPGCTRPRPVAVAEPKPVPKRPISRPATPAPPAVLEPSAAQTAPRPRVIIVQTPAPPARVVVLQAPPASKSTTERPAARPRSKPVCAGPVDLKTATAAELQCLPGIGPKRAADIVASRKP